MTIEFESFVRMELAKLNTLVKGLHEEVDSLQNDLAKRNKKREETKKLIEDAEKLFAATNPYYKAKN